MEQSKRAVRAWTRQQTRSARRAALPVVGLGLVGTLLAIGQVWCMAGVLAAWLIGRGGPVTGFLAAFGALAVARAALTYASEHLAFAAGAAARRRLRADALGRLLGAGPALLRTRHSADLAAVVVDRVEALEGLFARWVPAATLAVAAPVLVALAALWADPVAALVLA